MKWALWALGLAHVASPAPSTVPGRSWALNFPPTTNTTDLLFAKYHECWGSGGHRVWPHSRHPTPTRALEERDQGEGRGWVSSGSGWPGERTGCAEGSSHPTTALLAAPCHRWRNGAPRGRITCPGHRGSRVELGLRPSAQPRGPQPMLSPSLQLSAKTSSPPPGSLLWSHGG